MHTYGTKFYSVDVPALFNTNAFESYGLSVRIFYRLIRNY